MADGEIRKTGVPLLESSGKVAVLCLGLILFPALLLAFFMLGNGEFLDGFFGVYKNTPILSFLLNAVVLSVIPCFLAAIVIAVLFVRRRAGWSIIVKILLVLAIIPLQLVMLYGAVRLPPVINLNKCGVMDNPPENNLCDDPYFGDHDLRKPPEWLRDILGR